MMSRHNGQGEQKLLLDQCMQIQRIFAQFQHVITFRQRLGIRTLLHHSITAFAVDRQGDQLKTTLANHFDLGVDKTVNHHSLTFISFKNEFSLHRTDSVGKRVAESLQIGQQQFTLKGGATISQFARVNVRWNRVIQHRRSIIGMHPAMSKEIQPCLSPGLPARIRDCLEETSMLPLLLASSSVYRRELLNRLHLPFICSSPDIDESRRPDESATELVKRLAEEKARALAGSHPGHLIIGSDQVAALDGQIIGKPHTFEKAREQLLAASGKRISFLTGLAVLNSATGHCQVDCIPFTVHMRTLDAARIERYLRIE